LKFEKLENILLDGRRDPISIVFHVDLDIVFRPCRNPKRDPGLPLRMFKRIGYEYSDDLLDSLAVLNYHLRNPCMEIVRDFTLLRLALHLVLFKDLNH
jgi:hypothetical protein